jgi:hypothetical protein
MLKTADFGDRDDVAVAGIDPRTLTNLQFAMAHIVE